jgi:anaerobic magnesium-protoporphyrin IX monomethyl ester cyclase
MKIVFIYSGAESLGIEYLSSFLKSKGHETELLFDPAIFSGDQVANSLFLSHIFNVDDHIVQRALDSRPDLIAFSVYTGNFRWCLSIAERIKQRSAVPIVFGGVHPTAVPERVLLHNCVDFVIIGEGENALLDLLEHLKASSQPEQIAKLPNLGVRINGSACIAASRPYIQDLDSLPFPDKDLFFQKVSSFENNYLITTTRGCPFDCTYCSNNMLHHLYDHEKRHLRQRSVENVIEELIWMKKRGRMKLVAFADDGFAYSEKWLGNFVSQYRSKIDMPFYCSVHPSTVTRGIASLLKEGGCRFVTMGIESCSERIRLNIFNRKGSNEKLTESMAHIKEAGIRLSVDNIFGAPTETQEDLDESLAFYYKTKPDRILTFWLTYYPKTDIIKHALEANVLSQAEVDRIEEGYVGFAHDTGSITGEKVKLYSKYQLLFQLRSLIHTDRLYDFFSKFFLFLPFKKFTGKLVLSTNAIKNKDLRFFYLLRYLFEKKNTP